MVKERLVFRAKYGRGDELVALFKEAKDKWPGERIGQIMTDLTGDFFTVVVETTHESLASWEKRESVPGFEEWFARMKACVEEGRREFYSIVD